MKKEARAGSAGPAAVRPLRSRSVAAFLAAVASTDEPVPAGGSVAALCGAAAAGLLILVCAVRAKRHPSAEVDELGTRARHLQAQLTQLVDDDADAYRALLAARRTAKAGAGTVAAEPGGASAPSGGDRPAAPSAQTAAGAQVASVPAAAGERAEVTARAAAAAVETRAQAVARAAQVPIDIAAHCQDVLALAEQVAPHAMGAMRGDARTAALLAAAAAQAALDLADEDVARTPDATLRQTLEQQIAALRRRV